MTNLLCFHDSPHRKQQDGEADIGSTQPGFRLPPYLQSAARMSGMRI
jgi:hypothetical protein